MALTRSFRPLLSFSAFPRVYLPLGQTESRRLISAKITSKSSPPEAAAKLNKGVIFHPLSVKHVTTSQEEPSMFYDPVVMKFVNHMMEDGKKAVAIRLFNKALMRLKEAQLKKWQKASPEEKPSIERNPLKVFHEAFENVMPVMGTVRLRRGGRVHQIPIPLTDTRRRHLACKWILGSSFKRSSVKQTPERLADELLDALNLTGASVRKKSEYHKTAAANRAFAHYRWF